MSSEHIQVAIRLRPLNHFELSTGDRRIWTITKNTVLIRPESHHILAAEKRVSGSNHPSFQFDHCFSWDDDTAKVYENVVKRMVVSTLEGYNATVFAYGQTGSGKTFTMLGLPDDDPSQRRFHRPHKSSLPRNRSLTPHKSDSFLPIITPKKGMFGSAKGIMGLAFEDIFQTIKDARQTHYFLSCSYMEIYNEHIYDLLREEKECKDSLSVSETLEKDFNVKGLSCHPVQSIEDLLQKLEIGEEMRHYAETQMNHHSSRSHTIFRLCVKSLQVLQQDCEEEKSDNVENVTTESVLNFVDLAGSERLTTLPSDSSLNSSFLSTTKSDQDKTVAEGKHINTSLFYLCQVITKLSEMKLGLVKSDAHVPFRNSIVTKILRASLGGNARTCVLCTATPALSQFEQTLSTFRFGASARTITNKVQRNVRHASSAQLLLAYEQDVSDLRKELEQACLRSRSCLSESMEIKAEMENRVRKLTVLLYEKGKTDIKPAHGGWSDTAGELMSTEKLIHPSDSPTGITLKCDGSGEFAEERRQTLSTEIEIERKEITVCYTAAMNQHVEREKLQREIDVRRREVDEGRREVGELESRVEHRLNELRALRTKAEMYEHSLNLTSLPDEDLSGLEAELLISIDRVAELRARKRIARIIETLKERLGKYVEWEEVERVVEEVDGWCIDAKLLNFPDLSAISDSLPNETMDSVN